MDCNDIPAGSPNCDYDLAGMYLQHLLGSDFQLPWNIDYNSNGQFYAFDQTPYTDRYSYLFDNGFIYIPEACKAQECHIHIHFHGCGQTAALVGSYASRVLGLLEHASKNNIVMIFPHNYDESTRPFPHCWTLSL